MSTAHPYSRELLVATLAVKRASNLTKRLSDAIATTRSLGTQTKDDKSPVTVGDYAAQAIINHALARNFPTDQIVGEEDSEGLRTPDAAPLSARILEIVQQEQDNNDILGHLDDLESVFRSIDLGNSQGGARGRYWALDPIDGTKGFLRGDQFAVCLALIEDGEVVLGVIGCPNLPATIRSNQDQLGLRGGLYLAIRGVGAFYTPLFETALFVPLAQQERLHMAQHTSAAELTVVEGVEKGHSLHLDQLQIKAALGVTREAINLDLQVKYCVLARGQADVYLRLPVSDTYREKIWDHAAGNVLVYESGGRVGDIHGRALDFGRGRFLELKGVVAASAAVFDAVAAAVKTVLKL